MAALTDDQRRKMGLPPEPPATTAPAAPTPGGPAPAAPAPPAVTLAPAPAAPAAPAPTTWAPLAPGKVPAPIKPSPIQVADASQQIANKNMQAGLGPLASLQAGIAGGAKSAAVNIAEKQGSPAIDAVPTAAAPAVAGRTGASLLQVEDPMSPGTTLFGRFADPNNPATSAQLDTWLQMYGDPNCPDTAPFRSEHGYSGCWEKPVDCPPGLNPDMSNPTGPCVGGGPGAGGGGGTGGAGGAGGAGDLAGPVGAGGASGIEGQLQTLLAQILAPGGQSRYDPATMQGILGALKQQSDTAARNAIDTTQQTYANRGMLRSGAASTAVTNARLGGEAQFTQGYGDTLRAKAEADFQDRQQSLSAALSYLQQLRQAAQAQATTALQRDQLSAQIELAYANIQQEFDLNQQRAALGMLNG